MKLKEIDEAILSCIDPETGEVDAERIVALQMERDKKVTGVAEWILDMTGDVGKIDAEIERLQALKEQTGRRIERLKGFLRFALQDEAFDGATVKVRFRRSRALNDPTPETVAALPEEYLIRKVTETVKPDKKKLKAAIDAGRSFDGVWIEDRVSVGVE